MTAGAIGRLSHWTPSALLSRFRAAFQDTSLLGDDSYLTRYRRVQWCMTLWRFLVPPQLLLLILAAPDRIGSLPRALAIFAFTLVYTGVFAHLSLHTKAGGSQLFHTVDMLVVLSLFFLCNTSTLLYNLVFYSEAVLLSWPTIRLRQLLPRIILLSITYLVVENFVLINSNPVDYQAVCVALFFVWGFGFFGFTHILEKVSALELDSRLDSYRRSYRRRLHDDLGNTICGLHYKIQSLASCQDGHHAREALDFLGNGYARAGRVMKRLITGLNEPETPLDDSLKNLIAELRRRDSGIEYLLDLDTTSVSLSADMQGEIFRIIKEAATNTLKHACAGRLIIASRFDKDRMQFSVRDDGKGFEMDSDGVTARDARPDSFGIRGMRERATNIHGQLHINSRPGGGTLVTLEMVARKKAGFVGRLLNIDNMGAKGGLYPFLVRIMLFVLIMDLVRALASIPDSASPVALLVMAVLLSAMCLGWMAFQNPVQRLIEERPWLLILLQVFFAGMFAGLWHYDIEPFFEFTFNFSVIMSAYFLSIRSNFSLACVGGLLVIGASLMFPSEAAERSYQMEIMITNVASNLVFALTAGLAVEFVKNLEFLQDGVVSRAITRQREKLSAVTHKDLSTLIHRLGADVQRLGDNLERLDKESVLRIERRSADLKKRLRTILIALDEPLEESAGAVSESGLELQKATN